MARIRTIKPEFYRHEGLQDLEREHPSLRPMLVFSGLWGHCDKNGVFRWRPRQLALDVLPFLWEGRTGEQLERCLLLLVEHGLLVRFEHGGEVFGAVMKFRKHQRITGKEGQSGETFPPPPDPKEAPETHQGHTGDTPETHPGAQEGKGREVEVEVEGKGVNQRGRAREGFTPPTLDEIQEQAAMIGWPDCDAEHFLGYCTARGWEINGSTIRDWRAYLSTWRTNGASKAAKKGGAPPGQRGTTATPSAADFARKAKQLREAGL
jgi:hypothetical protein